MANQRFSKNPEQAPTETKKKGKEKLAPARIKELKDELLGSNFLSLQYQKNGIANFKQGYRDLYQNYQTGSGLNLFKWNMHLFGPVLGINFAIV